MSNEFRQESAAPPSQTTFFGIPIGDYGWFGTLLTSAALGFIAFFAGTFLGIVGILAFNSTTHANADYAASYRLVGVPLGLLVLLASLAYLGTLWVRRKLRKA
ncbi:MAG: hypothetical protein KGK08_04670 [Acidobacteriota bacterium]|nr:hypothetical protein [Acidobacteriota bacterium]